MLNDAILFVKELVWNPSWFRLTTGIIWAQVQKFERFGACFCTCALIIWSVLSLQSFASRALPRRSLSTMQLHPGLSLPPLKSLLSALRPSAVQRRCFSSHIRPSQRNHRRQRKRSWEARNRSSTCARSATVCVEQQWCELIAWTPRQQRQPARSATYTKPPRQNQPRGLTDRFCKL
jgi:hypothetical protein